MTAPNVEPEPILFIVHVKKLLGKVDLLNSYTVYEGDGAYTVTSESPRDQRYECRVVPEAVEYLCARTSGQSITSARAGAILEPSVCSSLSFILTATGYALYDLERYHEAYRHLRAYTELVPADGWAWCWLGKACEAMGEFEEARSTYEKAIELPGDETDAPELLVNLLDRSFRRESAGSEAPVSGTPREKPKIRFIGEGPDLRDSVEIVLEDGVRRGDLVVFEYREPRTVAIRQAGPEDEGTVYYVHPESSPEQLTFVRTNVRHLAAQSEGSAELGKLWKATFSGLGFCHRDAELEDKVLEKYRPEMIIQERAYVDCSYLDGGLAVRHRYLIITGKAKDLRAMAGMDSKYGPAIIQRNGFFKVLDVYGLRGHAQITLLHIPGDLIDRLRTPVLNEIEKEMVEATRTNFEGNLTKPAVPALTEAEWLDRIAFPLGISEEGDLFSGSSPGEPR